MVFKTLKCWKQCQSNTLEIFSTKQHKQKFEQGMTRLKKSSNAHLTRRSMMPDAVSSAQEECAIMSQNYVSSKSQWLFDILTSCWIKILSSISSTLSSEEWIAEVKGLPGLSNSISGGKAVIQTVSDKDNKSKPQPSRHVTVLLSQIRSTYLHTFCSLPRISWH